MPKLRLQVAGLLQEQTAHQNKYNHTHHNKLLIFDACGTNEMLFIVYIFVHSGIAFRILGNDSEYRTPDDRFVFYRVSVSVFLFYCKLQESTVVSLALPTVCLYGVTLTLFLYFITQFVLI